MKFHFSLSTKLFINNVFYAIPILVLLYMMFNTYDKDLIFARKEMMGNVVQRPAMELIHLVVKNKTYTQDMGPMMTEILALIHKYEQDLLLDAKSLHDRKRDQLESSALLKTFDEFKMGKADAYKVLKDLRELVIHTGDTSNLILDPDLDSYYLMDFTLIAAPQMADRFYEMESFLAELSAKPNEALTVDQKVKLSVYIAMLKESDWGRIYGDVGTAFNEDKNFYGTNAKLQNEVKQMADQLDTDFKKYFSVLESIANGNKAKATEAQALTAELLAGGQSFYLLTLDTLTDLLKTRDSSIVSTRNKATATGIGAIVIALLVSILTSMNFKSGAKRVSSALKLLMGAVKVNADASEKLTESSSSLSAVSSQQASAVQQTVSSLHQINSMSEKNFDSIKLSSQKTIEGKEQAIQGKHSISLMASTMKEIAVNNQQFFEEIHSSNEELEVIIKIISDISNRTKVINDIVFQTRLLSFNASVEAARAGDHGKGFAVVAEEIGKLATVSGDSAKEINDILSQATRQVESIIAKMGNRVADLTQKARVQLDSGERITNDCVKSLNDIVENVSELSGMMSEISMAITEQTKGYSEITKSINQIDEGVHHGLGLSEETSVHAKILHKQVDELIKIATTIEHEVLGVSKSV